MQKGFDLIVVGASFAGLACARSAAMQGLSVLCIERRLDTGAKLHTTGLLVKEVLDEIEWLRPLPPKLIRKIEQVRLYAPNLKHMDLQSPGYGFYATDTPGLMRWMLDAARMPFRPQLLPFLKHIAPVMKLDARQACGARAGYIPIGGIVRPVAKPRVLLVGDAAGMVSPLTAGGIHTALQHGAWAGDAVAAHLLSDAPDPGTQAVGEYPAFYWKKKLRWLVDRLPVNTLSNALIGTPPLRATAQLIYFHRRGLLSRTGWLALKA